MNELYQVRQTTGCCDCSSTKSPDFPPNKRRLAQVPSRATLYRCLQELPCTGAFKRHLAKGHSRVTGTANFNNERIQGPSRKTLFKVTHKRYLAQRPSTGSMHSNSLQEVPCTGTLRDRKNSSSSSSRQQHTSTRPLSGRGVAQYLARGGGVQGQPNS